MNNLGDLLHEEGRLEEAMALYGKAITADPRNARAAYNMGMAKLCRFDFAEGWRLCELRYYTTPPTVVPRPFSIPRFGPGDPGKGLRTAIWREQGIGDQLLYATLLPEFAARGESFVLEVDARLVMAFQRSYPGWNVVPPDASDEAFASCERHLPLASLPQLLRSSLESFSRQPAALLRPDATRVSGYEARLREPGRKVVGISWRSFQPKARGFVQRKKSMDLQLFHALSLRPVVEEGTNA
jgi:tetratricopeptide (TPR) repeat protein